MGCETSRMESGEEIPSGLTPFMRRFHDLKRKKNHKNRKLIFKRAKQYAKEYKNQEKELIQLKREARLKGGFYECLEAKLLFIIKIRDINAMHPITKNILQLLRLRQIFNGVFLKVNKATMNMLWRVELYVAYGYPNLKSVRVYIHRSQKIQRILLSSIV